jgi:hypothetical protein
LLWLSCTETRCTQEPHGVMHPVTLQATHSMDSPHCSCMCYMFLFQERLPGLPCCGTAKAQQLTICGWLWQLTMRNCRCPAAMSLSVGGHSLLLTRSRSVLQMPSRT